MSRLDRVLLAETAGIVVVSTLWALGCGIATPVHVKPSVDDCQKTLIQIDTDMGNVIAAVDSLALEDQAPNGPHRHIHEWWRAKHDLLASVASIASSVGHK